MNYIFHCHVWDKSLLWKKNFLLWNSFFKMKPEFLKENFLVQKVKNIISLRAKCQSLKVLFTGWNPSVEESIWRIQFCEINLSNPHVLDCKYSFCRRIEKWFPSEKISIVKKNCIFIYSIKSFWGSVNQKSFLMWNIFFKMKATCHYFGKIPSAERQKMILSAEIWIIGFFSHFCIQDEILL